MNLRFPAVVATSLLFAATAAQAELRNFQSFQGYTGILNTPNAATAPAGEIDLLYTNQIEPQWRDASVRKVTEQDNYLFTFGAFSYLEGALRLVEAPGRARDLSANFKVRMPWIPVQYPQLALGVQDLAGGAPHLRTMYAVASQDWDPVRLSLGYGRGPDRLDGPFGGAELRLADWCYLLAEHDTHQAAAGLRLTTPEDWPVSLGLTIRTPAKDPGEFDLAVGLRIPLGRPPAPPSPPLAARKSPEPPPSSLPAPPLPPQSPSAMGLPSPAPVLSETLAAHHPVPSADSSPVDSPPLAAPSDQGPAPAQADPESQLRLVRAALSRLGFEDVRVGSIDKDVFYFELENSHYNRNEVDGIGVALGTATRLLPPTFTTFVFRLKNLNLPVLEISGPVAPVRSYLNTFPDDWSNREKILLNGRIKIAQPTTARPPGLNLLPGVENPQAGSTSLVLQPGLRSTIGTEVGVFDYRLSAVVDLVTRLWPGGALNARADLPTHWSENFRQGAFFNRTGHNDPVVDRLFLTQAFKLSPSLTNQIGGGLYLEDTYGVLNETIWLPSPGNHRFRLQLGRFEQDTLAPHDLILGSYRYAIPSMNLSFEGTVGRFFGGDEGWQLEGKRFFGDVWLSAVYTNTEEQTVGLRIIFPLTPRRDMKPGIIQARGTERFGYQVSTVLAKEGSANPVTFGVGERAQTMINIERTIQNSDRLHPSYILDQLPRMRDANLRVR